MDSVGIFRGVFAQLQFPLLAVDLEHVAAALSEGSTGPTHVSVPLSDVAPERRAALIASLAGVFRSIEVPAPIVHFLAEAERFKRNGLTDAFLSMANDVGNFLISEQGDALVWFEHSLWPMAYSTVFDQFNRIMRLHKFAIEQRVAAMPGVDIISEYPRQLPTHQHYAFASLGAWLGGAINVQYFSYFATQPQIRESTINKKYAESMRYSADAAEALTVSGLIAIPANLAFPLLQAQGQSNIPIMGSIPVDEINSANQPAKSFSEMPDPAEAPIGFLLDKNYRAPFLARSLRDQALYGTKSLLRDHYDEFYKGLDVAGLVRIKHYSAPIVDVDSLEQIVGAVARMPRHHPEGIFFRGQGRLHTLNRSQSVRRFLFGDSCSDEPSLVTSASRKPSYDYDQVHFALRRFVEERVLSAEAATEIHTAWKEKRTRPTCELDYAFLALAQHYGLPSHGLDVTTSIDVAAWFATHRFVQEEDGFAQYHALHADAWPVQPGDWPVIIACQCVTHSIGQSLHDCHELAEFGLEAARPARQSARFFLGGHSDHQNRLAEAVVCIFRLRPGAYPTECTFASLFPSPEEDPAYQLMIDFAAVPQLHTLGTRAVTRFHRGA